MAAYMIAMYDIADEQAHLHYAEAADRLLDKYEATVLAGSDQATPLLGQMGQAGIVIEFPSAEAAEAFYEDPDYQSLKPMREAGTQNVQIMLL